MISGIGGGGYAAQMMRTGMWNQTTSSGSSETANALFSVTDVNGDGVIDSSELMTAVNGAGNTGTDGFFPSWNSGNSGNSGNSEDGDGTGSSGYLGMSGMSGMGGMSVLSGMAGMPPPPPEGRPNDEELFSQTDADGDGLITESELTDALAALTQPGNGDTPDAAELFALMDANGDGVVTEEEHREGLASLHGDTASAAVAPSFIPEQAAAELLASADANEDGALDASELIDAMSDLSQTNTATSGGVGAETLFTLLDADGDGSITETEYTEGMAALKAERETRQETDPSRTERISEALFSAVVRKYQLTASDLTALFGGSSLDTTA